MAGCADTFLPRNFPASEPATSKSIPLGCYQIISVHVFRLHEQSATKGNAADTDVCGRTMQCVMVKPFDLTMFGIVYIDFEIGDSCRRLTARRPFQCKTLSSPASWNVLTATYPCKISAGLGNTEVHALFCMRACSEERYTKADYRT